MEFNLLAISEIGDTLDILKQYGPFAGFLVLVTVFSLWRDWKREAKLTKRVETLEDETRNILLPLVKDCTTIIARNTVVMERLESHLNR